MAPSTFHFFSLYFITHQVWVSVLLIGVLQNVIFIPLRLIGNAMDQPLKDFEDELDTMETKQQQLVFTKKIREGNTAIVYYIFNFFVNAIAFFSAGRIFLIDFYTDPLKLQKMNLLYKWVPPPTYPLQGTIFPFPFHPWLYNTGCRIACVLMLNTGGVMSVRKSSLGRVSFANKSIPDTWPAPGLGKAWSQDSKAPNPAGKAAGCLRARLPGLKARRA